MDADEAARRIVRSLRRRRKVVNFPWQTTLLIKLTDGCPTGHWPGPMRDYNEDPPMPEGGPSYPHGRG